VSALLDARAARGPWKVLDAGAVRNLTPARLLEALCDPGTLQLVRTAVRSPALEGREIDGDGVIAGAGQVAGRPVLCYAEDPSFLGGSLGAQHAATIVELLRLAERGRRPVVGFVSSGGARLQEGLAALGGYGEIFAAMTRLSGLVPQLSVVSGASAGGGAYAPALGDIVIMTRDSGMFLTGPGVIAQVTGEQIDAHSLGGPKVQAANGVAQFVVDDEFDGAALARALLGFLPSAAGDPLPLEPSAPPGPGDPGGAVPADPRKVYDVREVIIRLTDRGELLEYGERWARNIVCGWARIAGRSVGLVGNQPRRLGGVLDCEASQKAARFVRTCHLFGIPLIALVDTPGFLPGIGQERAGVIRQGAKLVHAFAEARVPKLTVVLRKSFGGAHIAMNSKQLGADLVLAWPGATLGVMGSEQAVGIIHRRRLLAAADRTAEREALARAYALEHLSVRRAAELGFVDEVIEPRDTRPRLAGALELLDRQSEDPHRARNIPL
jgi:acetyl-CoA carboxylase carboxyltransferase component